MAQGQSVSSRVITVVLLIGIGLVIFYRWLPTADFPSDIAEEEEVIQQLQIASLGILGMSNWEDVKKKALANKNLKVTDGMIDLGGKGSLFRREVVDSTLDKPKGVFLLLHGMRFKSQDWLDLGTLHVLASYGFKMVAIDLPGFGNTPKIKDLTPVSLLTEVLKSLGMGDAGKVIVVSPSMSGSFSLPFLFAHPERFAGYVPVAPVGTGNFKEAEYNKLKVPTLIVYGDRDKGLGLESLQNLKHIPGSEVLELKDAGHACYLDQPLPFHKSVHNFADKVFAPQ